MKTPIYLLAIICFFFSSCDNSSKTKKVKISGIFKNVVSENVFLKSTSDSLIDLKMPIQGSTFEFEFELNEPMWFQLSLKKDKCKFPINTELYIEPGDEIELSSNTLDFYNTISAKGQGAEENNFLFSKYRIYYPDCSGWPPKRSLEVNKFLAQLDNMKIGVLKSMNTYNKEKSMNKHFIDFETRKAVYRWAYTKTTYPSFYKNIHSVTPNLPYDFYAFLDEIDFSDEEMYYSKTVGKYVFLVSWYLDYQVVDKKTGIEGFKDQVYAIEHTVKSKKMKDDFISSLIMNDTEGLTSIELQDLKDNIFKKEKYKAMIQEKIESI